MSTILGWDAAWTAHGSGSWCILRHHPGKALKQLEVWEPTPRTAVACNKRLNDLLVTYRPEMITIDMPVAKNVVNGYREADRCTTQSFSRYGCPVHSPSPDRPGQWGETCKHEMEKCGYKICTDVGSLKFGVMEVYPHTGLLHLLRLNYRFPYKVSRHRQLWPDVSSDESRKSCRSNMQKIYQRLAREIDLPTWTSVCPSLNPLTSLKSFEDKLDALICAWSGYKIQEGCFIPFGDQDAAIWNPEPNSLDPPIRTP